MVTDEVRDILSRVSYPNYTLFVVEHCGRTYMQGSYTEADIVTKMPETQYTRKWQLSEHMVPSEVVQTALKLVLTSAEHRVREHFLYNGERVYGPHFDVEALYELAKARRLDYRK